MLRFNVYFMQRNIITTIWHARQWSLICPRRRAIKAIPFQLVILFPILEFGILFVLAIVDNYDMIWPVNEN